MKMYTLCVTIGLVVTISILYKNGISIHCTTNEYLGAVVSTKTVNSDIDSGWPLVSTLPLAETHQHIPTNIE